MAYSKSVLSRKNNNKGNLTVKDITDKSNEKIINSSLELFISILKLKINNFLLQVGLSTLYFFNKLNLFLLF